MGAAGTGDNSSKPSSEYSLKMPKSDNEAELLVTVKSMNEGIKETIGILREMAAADRSRIDLETSKVQLNSLQVHIACFPVGSTSHTRAMELLEKYASEH